MKHPAVRVSLALLLAVSLSIPPAGAVEVRDVLGVAHVAGKYNFTDDDFLNEGGDRVLELGSRVIKVWFRRDADGDYPFNSDWKPQPKTYLELAQTSYYQELFDKPFSTYMLVIPPVLPNDISFVNGVMWWEFREEKAAFYQLARHLLLTYAGTGKTFVLQNWEGDHLLRQGLPPGADPDETRIAGMRAWWTARQEGVEEARREVGMNGVTVAHAAEVNLVVQAMEGKVTATNDVVPYIQADLYSYSSWDVGFDRTRLIQALSYLKAKAPASQLYGEDNIYLGEFGAVRDQVGPEGRLRDIHYGLAEAALGWGARWAVYWQLYCNAAAHVYRGRPWSSDLRGFWLIRPDGSKAPIWQDFSRRLHGTLLGASLDNAGRQVTAEEGGALRVRRLSDPATAFTLTDWNGGTLKNGDTVSLQTRDGRFWSAEEGSRAITSRAAEAATFTIWKLEGRGDILSGDAVALQNATGEHLQVGDGGLLRTAPGKVVPAATFRLRLSER